jgi:large subunit ribosomal protein L32
MAVPKKKTSKRRTGMRTNAKKCGPIALTKCAKCGEPKKSHLVCTFCGYYGGKKVLDVKTKLDKKIKKDEKKKGKEAEAEGEK